VSEVLEDVAARRTKAAKGGSLMWSFFQRRICLTNDPSEYALAEQEFRRVGLNVQPYHAVKEIGPHQSFTHSERNILLDFLFDSDANTLLHLEDDVTFRNLDHLPQAISELPPDWDVLYLGANLICWGKDEPWPIYYTPNLFKVMAAWTTHAVAYNKRCVRRILEGQPSFDALMFDNWLSSRLPELNAYCVAPMVAYQRPRVSSIWQKGVVDDYTDIFLASEAKLR
jgi:hypothetical protein